MARVKKVTKTTKTKRTQKTSAKTTKTKKTRAKTKKAVKVARATRKKKIVVKAKRSYNRKPKESPTVTAAAEIVAVAVEKAVITDEQISQAKSILSELPRNSIEHMKAAFNSVDRKDWNKLTHIVINGTTKSVMTEAVAIALGIA